MEAEEAAPALAALPTWETTAFDLRQISTPRQTWGIWSSDADGMIFIYVTLVIFLITVPPLFIQLETMQGPSEDPALP